MVNRSNRAGGATRRMFFSPKQLWALSIISTLLVVAAFRPAAAVTASPPQKKKNQMTLVEPAGWQAVRNRAGGRERIILYFILTRLWSG